jgi:hypothetical protein
VARYGRRAEEDRLGGPQRSDSENAAGGVVPHPFTGRLIDGGEAADWLAAGIADFSGSVSLCSAYLRAQALEALLAARGPGLGGRVLVRWQLADLLAGASDLRAYEVAKAAGLQFWVRLDFHGKVFCVPDRGIVVGSANATLSGLGLRSQSNEEVCTLVPSAPANLAHIERLFTGAVMVDDQLFAEISAAVHAASQLEELSGCMEWPESLFNRLQVLSPVEQLLASDCLWSDPVPSSNGLIDVLDDRDRQLLSLSRAHLTVDIAAVRFRQTKVFRWLKQCLERAGGQQFFGALTRELHDSLLDDPVMDRRDVKVLLQHILAWCEALPAAGVLIDRPQHSQRARLHNMFGHTHEPGVNFAAQGPEEAEQLRRVSISRRPRRSTRSLLKR